MPSDLDLKMHASLYMMLCGSVNEGEALGSEWWHTNFWGGGFSFVVEHADVGQKRRIEIL